ncbi:MAG: lipocalin-like domain-containing protein [Pseudomonadota bacterium]
MSARAWLIGLALAVAPLQCIAQGFAGMAADPEGFALPDAEPGFTFPADHGPHPDFRIEWWYVTANMTGPEGQEFGLQWTLFRSALAPGEAEGWQSPQIWMAHAALTTQSEHYVAEKFARGGIGQAGVTPVPFRAWIDDWEMGGDTLRNVTISVADERFGYDVRLSTDKPFVPQGIGGYSVKSEAGQASRYYSQPFYALEGVLHLPTGSVPVTGHAWLDREWSSQPLTETQEGWDWFSLVFDDGARFMGYQLRDRAAPAYAVATWIAPDGTPTPYPNGAFSAEPLSTHFVAGRDIPVRWRVTLPERGLDVEVSALNPDAWMETSVPYWEGPIRIEGSHNGRGYLEMTGYE